MQELLEKLPHRPPFLYVDEIIDCSGESIITKRTFPKEEAFFKGHFPDFAVVPGVILNEACFQTGALYLIAKADESLDLSQKLTVVTRIQNAKFKNMVRPGETIEVKVDLKEQLAQAYYMKGKVTVAGKTVLTVDFTVNLADRP